MKFTTDKTFIDTNVLFYAFIPFKAEKSHIAIEKIKELATSRALVLSTQVLQEFHHNFVKKGGASIEDSANLVKMFVKNSVVENGVEHVLNAILIQKHHQLSFWDSLIISSAASAKCKYLLSEDLNDGQKIEGVKIVNPFK